MVKLRWADEKKTWKSLAMKKLSGQMLRLLCEMDGNTGKILGGGRNRLFSHNPVRFRVTQIRFA